MLQPPDFLRPPTTAAHPLSWIILRNLNFKEISAQIFLKSQFKRNSVAKYLEIANHKNSNEDFKLHGTFYSFFQSLEFTSLKH